MICNSIERLGSVLILSAFFTTVQAQNPSSATTPVCQRTPQVRKAIERAAGKECKAIDDRRLGELTALSLRGKGLAVLKPGDLSGLSSLRELDLSQNKFKVAPAAELSALRMLSGLTLDADSLAALPQELFDSLSAKPGLHYRAIPRPRKCLPFYRAMREPKPAEVSLDKLADLLKRPVPANTVVVPWKYMPGVVLVALEGEGASEMEGGHLANISLDLFLVRTGEVELSLVAKTAESLRPLTDDAKYAWSVNFDLAPFRLGEKEYAFGVRMSFSGLAHKGTTHSWEEFVALRVNGAKLEPILRTNLYEYVEAAIRAPGKEEEIIPAVGCSVLLVSSAKTNGVFNWIEAPDDADKFTVIYRWNGSKFDSVR